MSQAEASVAWRLFSYNWLLLASMALALGCAAALTGFTIKPASTLMPAGIAAVYLAAGYFSAYRTKMPNSTVVFILCSTGQFLLIPILMTPLTYIAASANLPLQDAPLMALDRALGLDWLAYYNFFCSQRALLVAAVIAYGMIGWPVFGVPLALGLARQYRRMQEFTLAFALALIVTTVISTLVPAMGTYDLLNFRPDPDLFTPGSYLDQLRDLPLVRDGTLRELDLVKLAGIVTFPSFHAAAATLYLWALWSVRWMRAIALAANGAMLLATPLLGGHYFVDVFAGIAVAAASIVAAQWLAGWMARPATQAAESMVPVPAAAH